MLPSLVLITLGAKRRLPIPIPVFFLWPLIALFALPVGLAWLILPARKWQQSVFAKGALGLQMMWNLHGLKIDIAAHDGTNVYIRMI
jgi:hypothetical protein